MSSDRGVSIGYSDTSAVTMPSCASVVQRFARSCAPSSTVLPCLGSSMRFSVGERRRRRAQPRFLRPCQPLSCGRDPWYHVRSAVARPGPPRASSRRRRSAATRHSPAHPNAHGRGRRDDVTTDDTKTRRQQDDAADTTVDRSPAPPPWHESGRPLGPEQPATSWPAIDKPSLKPKGEGLACNIGNSDVTVSPFPPWVSGA